jgi:hypothetical protein
MLAALTRCLEEFDGYFIEVEGLVYPLGYRQDADSDGARVTTPLTFVPWDSGNAVSSGFGPEALDTLACDLQCRGAVERGTKRGLL